jgi:hypothetical protein
MTGGKHLLSAVFCSVLGRLCIAENEEETAGNPLMEDWKIKSTAV